MKHRRRLTARSYRLSARTLHLITLLAERYDVTNTSIVETAIAQMARREKITLDTKGEQEQCQQH